MTLNSGENLLELVGRFIVGVTFVVGGLRHIDPQTFSGLAGVLAARKVPFPRLSLASGTIFQMVAGSAFALSIAPRGTGAGLIIFTICASVIAHNFWDRSGQERTASLLAWQANSAIVGGLLLGMA